MRRNRNRRAAPPRPRGCAGATARQTGAGHGPQGGPAAAALQGPQRHHLRARPAPRRAGGDADLERGEHEAHHPRPVHQGPAGRRQRAHLPHLHARTSRTTGRCFSSRRARSGSRSPRTRRAKYYSTFYSIPVSFGEKVLFFPLGVSAADGQQKDFFNIELEIKIVPYEQKQ